MRVFLAAVLLLTCALAGCAASDDGDDDDADDGAGSGTDGGSTNPSGGGTTGSSGGTTGSSTASWPSGLLYRDPVTKRLAAVGATVQQASLQVGGFDLASGLLAQGNNEEHIQLRPAAGAQRSVAVQGAYHVGRVSLDPGADFAVVQATAGEGPPAPPANDFNIYGVNLADGTTTRIGSSGDNEESPEWSRDGSRIAYSSFSPVDGIDLHVVDASSMQQTRVIDDAGGIHISFSRDGASILESGRLRVHDVASGSMTHDLLDEAFAGLAAAGYEREDRFPGQANRGTFPLDGDFSPDGTKLVFDGAVKQGSGSAVVIATMGLDGSGFTIVAGPFTVDPTQTNGLNYSETNPMWV